MKAKRHILCLEGEWEEEDFRRKGSVLPMMKYLEENLEIPFIFRKVATVDSFFYYLNEFSKAKYKNFGLIYLAFHGEPGCIQFSKDEYVDIRENFPEMLRKDRALEDKYLHFGSCGTINISDEERKAFMDATGVKVLSGYSKDSDWLDAAFLDIAYFTFCQEYTHPGNIRNKMEKDYGALVERQGFEMVIG